MYWLTDTDGEARYALRAEMLASAVGLARDAWGFDKGRWLCADRC